jgi:hypothetical protein
MTYRVHHSEGGVDVDYPRHTRAPLVHALIRREIDPVTEIGTAATGFFFNELDRTGVSTHVRRRSRRPVQPASATARRAS